MGLVEIWEVLEEVPNVLGGLVLAFERLRRVLRGFLRSLMVL